MITKCAACGRPMVGDPLAERSLCPSCEQDHREATQAISDITLECMVNSAIEEAA